MSFRSVSLSLLLIALLVNPSPLKASSDSVNYYFTRYPVPDSLLRYDAVVMMDHTSTSFYFDQSMGSPALRMTLTIKRLIRFNTETGLRNYGSVSIPKNRYTVIERLKTTIIKPDGSSRETTPRQEEVAEGPMSKKFSYGYVNVIVPGVELGDMVLFSYRVRQDIGGGSMNSFFFREEAPILNASYKFYFSQSINYLLKTYNGLQKPAATEEERDSVYTFSYDYLPPLIGTGRYQPYYDLPYLRYAIISVLAEQGWSKRTIRISPSSWTDLFAHYVSKLSEDKSKMKNAGYTRNFLAKELDRIKSEPKLEQFRKIHGYINDSVAIELQRKRDQSPGWYLAKKNIDRNNLFYLYQEIFDLMGIPSYMVFARSRSEGPIDPDFLCSDVSTLNFFAFKDEDGQMHYLIPKYRDQVYSIDEIPSIFRGTMAFLVPMGRPVDHSMISLPSFGPDINATCRQVDFRIFPEGDSMQVHSRIKYTGESSTEQSIFDQAYGMDTVKTGFIRYMKLMYPNFRCDSLKSHHADPRFPFEKFFTYGGMETGVIQKVNDSLYSLDIMRWIKHAPVQEVLPNQNISVRVPYQYTEKNDFNIGFPSEITLVNSSQAGISRVNDLGSYALKVWQVDGKTLAVSSEIAVARSIISPPDYPLLTELNHGIDEARVTRLYIKMKKTD